MPDTREETTEASASLGDPDTGPEPGRAPRRWSARRRFRVATAALAVAAGLVAIVGSAGMFPYLSQNSDEGAYLAQAAALRAGELVPEAPDRFTDLFQPWFAVLRDGHFVYKYPPVHAALLAVVPDALGGPRLALGLIAAAAAVLVVALARELGAGRRAAWVAGALFVGSPVVIVQSATFLPYLANLMLLLGFAVLVRRGARTGSLAALAGGGLVLGVAFWARPYDAFLFATPLLVWQGARCRRRSDPVPVGRLLGVVALGAIPGLVGFLGYNALTTGSPLRLPFRLQEQADNLGFGQRRTNPFEPFFDYTPGAAVRATGENLRLLLTWSLGSVMLVVLGVYGTFVRPLDRSRWLLTAWLVVWPLGFCFFWGSFSYIYRWDGGRYLGPYYYLPMLVPLTIAAGLGIGRAWTHARWVVAVFAVAALALAVPQLAETVDDNLARTEHRRVVARAIDDAAAVARTGGDDGRALVFVPGVWGRHLQHPFSFLRNAPGYDGERVYALESGNRVLALQQAYADRSVLLLSLPDGYRDGADRLGTPAWAEPQDVARGSTIDVALTDLPPDTSIALRFELAGRRLDVPVDRAGAVRARMVARDGMLSITAPGTAETMTLVPTPDDQLRVSVVRPLTGGGVQRLEERLVPLQVDGSQVAVMWPGSVAASVLTPSATGPRWTARTVAT